MGKQQKEKRKPNQTQGGLVGNYQESERKEPNRLDDQECERAPGGLVGNYQKGHPDCDPEQSDRQ